MGVKIKIEGWKVRVEIEFAKVGRFAAGRLEGEDEILQEGELVDLSKFLIYSSTKSSYRSGCAKAYGYMAC